MDVHYNMQPLEDELYTDESLIVPPKDLDELCKELHKVFSYDRVNVDYVKTLLNSYKSKPKDWKKYAKFDPHRYTRNLIDSGNGKFNVMALCWNEGMGSSIHDHAKADCFVKVLDGCLMETKFAWPDSESSGEQEMVVTEVSTFQKDGVAYMCDDLGLHRMENPSHTDPAVTLHIYVPGFMECQTFDQRTGFQREAKMTFWSKNGVRTPFTTDTVADPAPPPKTKKDKKDKKAKRKKAVIKSSDEVQVVVS